jgi:hypothetical protein
MGHPSTAVLALVIVALGSTGQRCLAQQAQEDLFGGRQEPNPKVAPPLTFNPCAPSDSPDSADKVVSHIQYSLIEQAAGIVNQTLNAATDGPETPQERATAVLKQMEQLNKALNPSWPEENRFHFQMLDLPPVLVVKMSIGTHARFFVFGMPEQTPGQADRLWQQVGSDDISLQHESARSWLDLYPLHRGPSGRARFLARIGFTGCAGNSGVLYQAFEWDPSDGGDLAQIIDQAGAVDGAFDGDAHSPNAHLAAMEMLRTEGPVITLPYCLSSSADSPGNTSLCAADAYDLSRDDISFLSRAYNRPDLVPIAKAIEYAQKRDYQAVLGYCASSDVARRIVRYVPLSLFSGDLRVIRTGPGKERIEMGDSPAYSFDVEERGGRWQLVAFGPDD